MIKELILYELIKEYTFMGAIHKGFFSVIRKQITVTQKTVKLSRNKGLLDFWAFINICPFRNSPQKRVRVAGAKTEVAYVRHTLVP